MPLRTANSAIADGDDPGPVSVVGPRSVLLVDPDRLQVARLKRLFEERHFRVHVVETIAEALRELAIAAPDCAVIEVHLPDGSGLDVLAALNRVRPGARAVVLTNYGNIASAVVAIKRGAVDYLVKPGDFEEIHALLCGATLNRLLPDARPMSADRVRWEHIQRIYEQCGHNVSETARRLNMHRRTLQRILAKRAPR
ncbi:MAG: two-component system response regulator [Rhizobiales bacterium PAR1]|nr:MAG: two-component system response regulator [Rhizobiales bacterium PAR1]